MSFEVWRETNPDMIGSTDMSNLRDTLLHTPPRALSPAPNQQQQIHNLQNLITMAVNTAIANNNELWEEIFASKDVEVLKLRRRLAETERRQPLGMGLPRAPEAEFRKMALAKPKPYNGDKKKFQSFSESLELHFTANQAYFSRERNWISFALSYMSIGAAAALRTEWVERRKIAEERSDGGEITLLESWAHFKRTLKDHFADTHKEEKAKYEIMYKKQGALTAQEFFVKFQELRRQDGYDIKRNEQFLITLIRNNVNGPLIKQIIYNGNVPMIYVEWKTRIVTNNQLWGTSEKKAERVELKKDGTGTLYTGAGKEMEVDKQKFRVEGRCFKCGEKGHRARDHLNGQIPEKKPKRPAATPHQTVPKNNVNRYASLTVDDLDATCTSKDENNIALFKDAQDLRRKEQSMKEENLKGKWVDKIPKDAAQSVPKGDRTERSAAAKKETTEAQNVMTQLGSITETDASCKVLSPIPS
ncbi:hypothetical protein SERLADRAFT_442186 [Serpula lacrymans var. lacrymans S7.9]|uniref:CCHC-type domain-containing protein n=1 Tax=Serpula lacrymans var. lacrymans (strain S7.9) TaxID=578457 RepID=F8P8R8_SERL9|nr:uncharacterized protein SERLADRAFT_442186 [Serpula lacrymans var. lacrymans S7.9]EGO20824.1 hypothetical protein SERLADRAFT_442186 [Serpula lacrymans var. lacrymans S7.9]